MVSVSVRQERPEAVERNSYEYPHPDNPGLSEVPGQGYFDWAGRRLFLLDGSPDPATPGAYRYQTRPDLCDVEAPDSDPASPRYEPPHLRHQPGDTFEIGGKPYDPEDPGPYGTPGWRQDRRTGRHRRGELPDPIPPWEQEPEPVAESRPSPHPRRRRFTSDEELAGEEPYRFSDLREDAWDRWLVDSEPLAAAHTSTFSAAERESGRTIATLLRLVRWIVAVFKGSSTSSNVSSSVDDSAELRRLPTNRPAPRTPANTPYIVAWENNFDSLHPVAKGGAL
ncbi:hypothetical protein L0U85_19235 [Glycomyces sp. L485]|uniref:hypothetical protein n=1 Tax=Glycomyces sp. L485 TaxID=2909235 RepID=UPI001F4BA0A4|nr:hypothetical protein [Glycomyces sp. L485]MCH7232970.1 hypothetical protein [Glycomyces sp. L485]